MIHLGPERVEPFSPCVEAWTDCRNPCSVAAVSFVEKAV
jgi:hypothetical protein